MHTHAPAVCEADATLEPGVALVEGLDLCPARLVARNLLHLNRTPGWQHFIYHCFALPYMSVFPCTEVPSTVISARKEQVCIQKQR